VDPGKKIKFLQTKIKKIQFLNNISLLEAKIIGDLFSR